MSEIVLTALTEPKALAVHLENVDMVGHACRVPQNTSPRLQLVRIRRKVAGFSSAPVRTSDRFRGPLCLRDSQLRLVSVCLISMGCTPETVGPQSPFLRQPSDTTHSPLVRVAEISRCFRGL